MLKNFFWCFRQPFVLSPVSWFIGLSVRSLSVGSWLGGLDFGFDPVYCKSFLLGSSLVTDTNGLSILSDKSENT